MTTRHDKHIAQAVRDATHAANQRHQAPDFDAMWQRAAAQPHAANDDHETPAPRRAAPLLIACAALLLAAATWWTSQPAAQPALPAAPPAVATHDAPNPAPNPAPEDPGFAQLDEAAQWDAPTDFLLAEGTLWDDDEPWDAMWDEPLDEQL